MAATIRWGILSTANIGLSLVIPGMQRSRHGTVAAIASRDAARAQAAAAKLGIPKAYGSYEALLADPEIDAVYNPLPNHLHVDWTIEAVRAGKHVLCEKPIGLTAADAERLRAVAGDRLVMEAFMIRFHPQWLRVRDLIRAGRIGELKAVQVFYAYDNKNPDDIRNKADIGGGAIMDIGCYCIVSARLCFGVEPKRVVALIDRDPTFRTDRLSSAMADFGEGRQLTFTVGTQLPEHQLATMVGTGGRIEVVIPYDAPNGEMRIRIDDGSKLGGASSLEKVMPFADQYAEEVDAFARAVLGETPLPYDVEDGIRNMKIIDALFRSETSRTWEETGL